ncbi:MAG: spore coat U domain-containing protein [Guyparkeria sp.]|uniref:Csu type fimbrial protein n=1 Tax=Guyparkeria sp. TaxID=2035736 RepID=UPI003978C127
MKTKALLATMGLLAATIGGKIAMAATDTTTFEVTATVEDACAVSATDLAFGTYDPNAGDLDGTSTITASCTEGTSYDIGLDTGENADEADGTTRAMVGASATTSHLSYELYSDSERTTVWGDEVGTDTVSGTASEAEDEHTVYGQIPEGQFVTADSYSDTITVTITY